MRTIFKHRIFLDKLICAFDVIKYQLINSSKCVLFSYSVEISWVEQLPVEQSIIRNSPTIISLLFCTVSVAIHPIVPNPDRNKASPIYWVTNPILDHLVAVPQYGILSELNNFCFSVYSRASFRKIRNMCL